MKKIWLNRLKVVGDPITIYIPLGPSSKKVSMEASGCPLFKEPF